MRLGALDLNELKHETALRELVGMPENHRVERKRSADSTTLAKVVSGFANASGGWLLLGVDDDGAVVGWQPAGRAHFRDWLRDVLDNHLDPVPHFDADTFDLDGTQIGIVRVPRSVSAPHFMPTGEVYERRNGQTRRASAARVRELTLREADGGLNAARGRLDDRLVALDLAIALDAPRESRAMDARALASIVRISLTESSASLAAWAHSAEAMQASEAFVLAVPQTLNQHGRDWFDPPRPLPAAVTAGGHTARAEWDGRIVKESGVGWDLNGVGGVRLAGMRPDASGVYYLLSDEVRDGWLSVGLEYLLGTLESIGAFGTAIVRWDLYGIRQADVIGVNANNVVVSRGAIPPHYNNMVALDTQIEVGSADATETAAELWLQLERLAGSRAPQ
jgi:Putative DNA-binding domain